MDERKWIEVSVSWRRVLTDDPCAFVVLYLVTVVLVAVTVPHDGETLAPALTAGAGSVVFCFALLVRARRRRRTGDRAGIALRIDRAGIYLGERSEIFPWSAVRRIDIWTTHNTADGRIRTDRIRVDLGPPPSRRDLPTADAERVRTVVEHVSPHRVPVLIHQTSECVPTPTI